jgi:hypothetical protein
VRLPWCLHDIIDNVVPFISVKRTDDEPRKILGDNGDIIFAVSDDRKL